jgi:chromosome segregation ATPase
MRIGVGEMSGSLKETVNRLQELEKQKLQLQAEVEELKKMAEAKATALSNEISSLREEINSLKSLMAENTSQTTTTQPQPEDKVTTLSGLVEKTCEKLNQLSNQVFSGSPYRQNFDKWMADTRETLAIFMANYPVIDDQFIKEQAKTLREIESLLSQKKVEESNIEALNKKLAENNQLLQETEKEYQQKSAELNAKRNVEVEPLTNRIRDLEKEIQSQEDSIKRKILLKTPGRLPQAKQNLKSAKDELDSAMQNLNSEQEKLRNEYEDKKRGIMYEGERLSRDLERLKIDTSMEARQVACKSLANSVDGLVQRNSSIT